MEFQFYTVEQVAKILNTKASTVRTYCRDGKIPAIRIGRGYRIAKEDLEKWLRLKKQSSTSLDEEHQRLLEAEAKYRDLFENANDGIILFDTKGLLVLANPKAYEMSGYTRKEAEGMHFARFIHPEDLPLATERFMSRMAGEDVPSKYEVRYLHKDGQVIPIEISGNVVTKEGEPSGIQIILRDTSERKKAEKQIAFLSKVLETSPLSVIATDNSGHIQYINPATERLYGCTKEELVGENPGILNAEPDAERIQKEIFKTARRGKIWRGQLLNKRKNGELFHIQLSVYQLLDENGDFVALVGFQEDITEQREVHEQRQRLVKTIEEVDEGIAILDEKGTFIFANKVFTKSFGYRKKELMGKSWQILVPKEHVERIDKEAGKSFDETGKWEKSLEVARKDGRKIGMTLSITILKDKDGKPSNYVNIIKSISG